MENFNLQRLNLKKSELGEQLLNLERTTYPKPNIKDDMLVDKNGNSIGTKGDMYTKAIMARILKYGTLDQNPRPYYIDFYEGAKYDSVKNNVITATGEKIEVGQKDKINLKSNGVEIMVPAHTISVNNGIECTYDLSRGESPLTTLRPIAIKTSVAEILWIYQKESNDLVEFDELLGKRTWEIDHKVNNWWLDWAIKNANGEFVLNELGHPHIGSCYGSTTGRNNRHMLYKVIDGIKDKPDGRRHMTCLWQVDDFNEPYGLKPCAFLTVWNVRHGWDGINYLDMTMVQRSSDFATAGCINQTQYAALQIMVAQCIGLTPGYFTWKPVNTQLYDRHIDAAIEMLHRDPVNCQADIKVNKDIENFEDFTPDDVEINDYPHKLIRTKNPQLKLPLGV